MVLEHGPLGAGKLASPATLDGLAALAVGHPLVPFLQLVQSVKSLPVLVDYPWLRALVILSIAGRSHH